MSPKQLDKVHESIRQVAAARKAKAEKRLTLAAKVKAAAEAEKEVDAATAEFDRAAKAEDRAVAVAADRSGVGKGEELFFTVDGETWQVEHKGPAPTVKRVKAQK